MLRLPFPEFLLRWFNNRKRDKTTETLNDFPHLHHQNLLRMYLLILCLQKWILSYKPTKWSPLKYHYLWGNHDNSLVRLLVESQYARKMQTCKKNCLCVSFSIKFIIIWSWFELNKICFWHPLWYFGCCLTCLIKVKNEIVSKMWEKCV